MHTTYATFFILAAPVIQVAIAQTVHIVTVGDAGSFFDPQAFLANAGDTVVFRWTGMFHSVTQSSFASPCAPLPGGFDSGVTGNPLPQLVIPEWNLTITDDNKPIWFFCKVTSPVSHCTAGMVGAINADLKNGNQSFAVFLQNAKSITEPPKFSHMPPALTGIGAFATSTPVPTNNDTNTSTTDTASISSSGTPSAISTPVQATQSQTTSSPISAGLTAQEKGGIAGGIVGGLIVISLLFLLFSTFRRGRRYKEEAEATKILYSQTSREVMNIGPSGTFFRGGPHDPPQSASLIPQVHRSQGSASLADSLEQDSALGPSINIKELAAEIAKNIRQDGSIKGRPEGAALEAVPELAVANPISRDTSASARAPESLRGMDSLRSESTRGTESTPGVESTRGTESTRGMESTRGTDVTEATDSVRTIPVRGVAPRQLPRPPSGPARSEDTYSVDTLPAYFPGQNR